MPRIQFVVTNEKEIVSRDETGRAADGGGKYRDSDAANQAKINDDNRPDYYCVTTERCRDMDEAAQDALNWLDRV